MAKKKKALKAKEPIKLRAKSLSYGNKASIWIFTRTVKEPLIFQNWMSSRSG